MLSRAAPIIAVLFSILVLPLLPVGWQGFHTAKCECLLHPLTDFAECGHGLGDWNHLLLVSRKSCIHEAKFIKKQSRKSFSFEVISNTDLCWDLETSKNNCWPEQDDLKPLGLQRSAYRSCVACCPGFPILEVLLEQAQYGSQEGFSCR